MTWQKTWTKAQDDRLSMEWRRGTGIKLISQEVGHSPSAVKSRRVHLGLPPRQVGRSTEVTVRLEPDLHRKAGMRAMARGQSLSSYMRSLVLRDV